MRYLYDNDDSVENDKLAESTALHFSDVSTSWNWTQGPSTRNNMVVQDMNQDMQRCQLTPDTQLVRPSFSSGRSPFFLEAFNLLNAVNFENTSGVIASGSFATYTTARDARQIQWGPRIQF